MDENSWSHTKTNSNRVIEFVSELYNKTLIVCDWQSLLIIQLEPAKE